MLRYYEGTVFNSGATWLVNTVNCEGFMGAGLALEFRLRYPKMYEAYKAECDKRVIALGHVSYYSDDAYDIHVINFPTKAHFKYPSRIEWIEAGLKDFVATYKQHGITSVAFSKLGCGKGGLDWVNVKSLMEQYLAEIDAEVIICLDSRPYAEGKERSMVEAYNQINLTNLPNDIRLSAKQIASLERLKPITRFFEIGSTAGIGTVTYEKLFRLFYDSNNSPCEEQLSLF